MQNKIPAPDNLQQTFTPPKLATSAILKALHDPNRGRVNRHEPPQTETPFAEEPTKTLVSNDQGIKKDETQPSNCRMTK